MFLFYFIKHVFRLRAAYDELSEMLKNEKDLQEKDEYIKALTILEEAKTQLS